MQSNRPTNSTPVIRADHPLVVVHTPKCGGTSLRATLRTAFGAKNMFVDYKKIDPDRPKAPPGSYSVIYGHFPASKYADIQDAMWVTLLREPVDRVLSLYFNWRFYPLHLLKAKPDALRQAVFNNEIGLLDFARDPRFSEAYHRRFFGGFDMTRFDLIILTDRYAAGIQTLAEKIRKPLKVEHKNVSGTRSEDYAKARKEAQQDAATMSSLRDILRKEIEFYDSCVRLPAAAAGGGNP